MYGAFLRNAVVDAYFSLQRDNAYGILSKLSQVVLTITKLLNNMNFFEYLFCRLYWWNTQIIEEKIMPIAYSISGLSMFHTLNIFPIYCILYIYLFDSYLIKGSLGVNPFLIIGAIVILVNCLYFRKPKYLELLEKFKKTPENQKKKMDVLCIVYITVIIRVNAYKKLKIDHY